MVDSAGGRGFAQVAIPELIERAGVSRQAFYEHFADEEECFLAAFDRSAGRLLDAVRTGARRGREGPIDRIRLGLDALLRFAASEPHAARLLIVEARTAGAAAAARRCELLDRFAGCLREQARELLARSASNSSVTASAIVGGLESILRPRLSGGEPGKLELLLPDLIGFVAAYLGQPARER